MGSSSRLSGEMLLTGPGNFSRGFSQYLNKNDTYHLQYIYIYIYIWDVYILLSEAWVGFNKSFLILAFKLSLKILSKWSNFSDGSLYNTSFCIWVTQPLSFFPLLLLLFLCGGVVFFSVNDFVSLYKDFMIPLKLPSKVAGIKSRFLNSGEERWWFILSGLGKSSWSSTLREEIEFSISYWGCWLLISIISFLSLSL